MFIKKLELKNFQVIKEFNADFTGNVYFITGDNELGKSTVLKAITALLTGNRDVVLRNGESKGFAKMVVGGDGKTYEVELKFTSANPRGTLTIKYDGMRSDNLSMLQHIFGYTDFDAVEFSRWSETAEGRRKQIAVVKSLLPEKVRTRIDEIDAENAKLYDQRTEVNRELKTYTSIFQNAEKALAPGDLEKYAEAKDITALMDEQRVNAQLIEKAKTVRAAKEQRIAQLAGIPDQIKEAEATLQNSKKVIEARRKAAKEAYEKAIAEAESTYKAALAECDADAQNDEKAYKDTLATIDANKADWEQRKANAEKWLAAYEANNPENLDTASQLQKAEEHNKKHALVADYLEKKSQVEKVQKEADAINADMEKLKAEREELIANAKLPISGLTFSDDGLQLNGVPFIAGQVSDSQIMEVAAKLIIASNPTVKVFCIARGESLGAKRLKSIIDIAKKNGFQGFIEEVKRGQDDLVIEEYTENE